MSEREGGGRRKGYTCTYMYTYITFVPIRACHEVPSPGDIGPVCPP